MDDIAAIDQSIREAAAWCRLRADSARPAESLRTPELLPAPWPPHRSDQDKAVAEERRRLVAAVVQRRRDRLTADRTPVDLRGPLPTDGLLVMVWPDSGLGDLCAQEVTGGFFDVEELPGADTWVHYVVRDTGSERFGSDEDTRLLVWIPGVFRPLWHAAKEASVFDNYDVIPSGASAADALSMARRSAHR